MSFCGALLLLLEDGIVELIFVEVLNCAQLMNDICDIYHILSTYIVVILSENLRDVPVMSALKEWLCHLGFTFRYCA